MADVYFRIGSSEDAVGYDDADYDSSIETTAPIKAGDPIDVNDVVTLSYLQGTGTTKITANGVTLGGGPPTSPDAVADLQTANDGNIYTVSEIAGNAGQNLVVDFTGVVAFRWVQILSRYAGQGSHSLTLQLEVTPFDGSAWHTFDSIKDLQSNQNFENHSFQVPNYATYINSGVVKVRYVHEMNGNAVDNWVIDVVALYV